jgi:hypothetical protein
VSGQLGAHGSRRRSRQGRSGAELAALALLAPARAMLGSDLGRRLVTVAALTAVVVALLTALYDHAEAPAAEVWPGGRPQPAAGIPHRPATGVPARPGTRGAARPAASMDAAAASPAAAAVAWYARAQGVPAGRVRALQQQRLGATQVRVLVLADLGGGRMPSALVTARHGPTGWTAG